ncbi:hypothetical protein EON68_00320 [archaeon]|nr:MAG: hypothetical protein EON68_00320 [archaeon]
MRHDARSVVGALRSAVSAAATAGGAAASPSSVTVGGAQSELDAFLTRVFTGIASAEPMYTAGTPVILTTARCIHAYATWVAARPTLVDGCANYLLKALCLPGAAAPAAAGLRMLLPRSAARFNSLEAVRDMLTVFQRAVLSRALVEDDIGVAAAAIMRVLITMPAELAEAAMVQLVDCCMPTTLQAVADAAQTAALVATAASAPAATVRRGLADDLLADAAARAGDPAAAHARATLTQLEDTVHGELGSVAALAAHIAEALITPLLAKLWPVLSQLPSIFHQSDAVMGGVSGVLTATFANDYESSMPALREVLNAVLEWHEAHPHCAWLEAVSNMVESMARASWLTPERAAELFDAPLTRAANAVFAMLARDSNVVRESPQLITSLYTLCTSYVLLLPTVIIPNAALPTLLQGGMSALALNSQVWFRCAPGYTARAAAGSDATHTCAPAPRVSPPPPRAVLHSSCVAHCLLRLWCCCGKCAGPRPTARHPGLCVPHLLPYVPRHLRLASCAVHVAPERSAACGSAHVSAGAGARIRASLHRAAGAAGGRRLAARQR